MNDNRVFRLFPGLCAAFLTLFSLAPHAAGTTATVSWVAPTTYTDGQAVVAGDIASYTVKWSGTVSGSKTVTGTSTTVPVACGSVSFVVYVTTSATAKYPNVSSADSSPPIAYASGVTCTINPPTAVTAS